VGRQLDDRWARKRADLDAAGKDEAIVLVEAVIGARLRDGLDCRIAVLEFVERRDVCLEEYTFRRIGGIVAAVIGEGARDTESGEVAASELFVVIARLGCGGEELARQFLVEDVGEAGGPRNGG